MDQPDRRLTVLVVDDDPGVRMVLDTCLGLSFDVVLAEDGHLALVMVDSTLAFDVAIVDVMMPGIDGFEVAAHIRDARPGTPVIMLSALDDGDTRDRALQAGATTYLTKPFDPALLEATIERLAGATTVRPAGATDVRRGADVPSPPALTRAQTAAQIVPSLPVRPLPTRDTAPAAAGLMRRGATR